MRKPLSLSLPPKTHNKPLTHPVDHLLQVKQLRQLEYPSKQCGTQAQNHFAIAGHLEKASVKRYAATAIVHRMKLLFQKQNAA